MSAVSYTLSAPSPFLARWLAQNARSRSRLEAPMWKAALVDFSVDFCVDFFRSNVSAIWAILTTIFFHAKFPHSRTCADAGFFRIRGGLPCRIFSPRGVADPGGNFHTPGRNFSPPRRENPPTPASDFGARICQRSFHYWGRYDWGRQVWGVNRPGVPTTRFSNRCPLPIRCVSLYQAALPLIFSKIFFTAVFHKA